MRRAALITAVSVLLAIVSWLAERLSSGKLFPKRQQTFFYLIAAIEHVNVNIQDVAIGFIEGVKRRYSVFEYSSRVQVSNTVVLVPEVYNPVFPGTFARMYSLALSDLKSM
jgi:hypothetical protein